MVAMARIRVIVLDGNGGNGKDDAVEWFGCKCWVCGNVFVGNNVVMVAFVMDVGIR